MRIVLHILLKDMRRHRWEMGLYLLSCGAWAWQTQHRASWQWLREKEIAPIVMFGLWFLITIRAIQGECLVGDREFWMTRPYHWAQLLAAKVMFLVICLNVPLLVAEVALLGASGVPMSWGLVPGLLYLQFLFFFFLTFPTAALASMSASIVQWLLTVGLLGIYGLVLSWFPWDKLPVTFSGDESVAGFIGGFLIVPLLAFALVWQYVRRRVWLARVALAIAALVIPFSILISAKGMVRTIAYPMAKANPPLRLELTRFGQDGEGREYFRHDNMFGITEITLPVAVQSGDADTMIGVDGARLTLQGDDGWRWQSKWMNLSLKLGTDFSAGTVKIDIPTEVADQIQRKNVHVQAEFAYDVYRIEPMRKVETSNDRFTIPGVGVCSWKSFSSVQFSFSGIYCAAPLRLPEILLMRVNSDNYTCPLDDGEDKVPAGHSATGFESGTNMPAEFDPNPIRSFSLNFGSWVPAIAFPNNPTRSLGARLCRGTVVFVRTGRAVNSERATFDLGPIGAKKRIQSKDDQDSSE